jgi:hypothetical protein
VIVHAEHREFLRIEAEGHRDSRMKKAAPEGGQSGRYRSELRRERQANFSLMRADLPERLRR